MKRQLVIESSGYLHVEHNQLIYERKDSGVSKVPLEDIGLILVESREAVISAYALDSLMQQNAVIISCGADHHPSGMMVPLFGNSLHASVVRYQADSPRPRKKRMWAQTVSAKLSNQAAVMEAWGKDSTALRVMAGKVRSGDPHNVEARGAAYYWKQYVPGNTKFVRDREGDAPNNLLNYGYAIIRAAMARAIVCSGLNPALGIHHSNKYNPFCLADDLMEPYRPFVDMVVRGLMVEGNDIPVLDKFSKSALLRILTMDSLIEGAHRPILHSMTETTSSVVRILMGTQDVVVYPSIPAGERDED
jgi:CRISPR-associated protein Cas1